MERTRMRDLGTELVIIVFTALIAYLALHIYNVYKNQQQYTTDLTGNNKSGSWQVTSIQKVYSCNRDSDCDWAITNCCTALSGAAWECLNKKTDIRCGSEQPCVIGASPKPATPCICTYSRCTHK